MVIIWMGIIQMIKSEHYRSPSKLNDLHLNAFSERLAAIFSTLSAWTAHSLASIIPLVSPPIDICTYVQRYTRVLQRWVKKKKSLTRLCEEKYKNKPQNILQSNTPSGFNMMSGNVIMPMLWWHHCHGLIQYEGYDINAAFHVFW